MGRGIKVRRNMDQKNQKSNMKSKEREEDSSLPDAD